MSEQQQHDDDHRHPVQTVLLITLESLITFLLKTDRSSRQQARALIQREALIEVRTYFPADTFYATFTSKGVLLDFSLPEGRMIDGIVTASIPDLTRAFMTAPPQILEKIRVEGDDELVESLKALMNLFNIQHIMRNWWRGVWGDDDQAEQEPKYNVKRMRRLQKQADEQQKTIEGLNLQLHEQAYQYRQLQYRYQRLQWITASVGVLLSLVIAFLLIRL